MKVEYQLLNVFLCKRSKEGIAIPNDQQPALKYIKLLEVEDLERVFSDAATKNLFILFKKYYHQYKDLPSQHIFDRLIETDTDYQSWVRTLSLAENQQREEVERNLFKEIPDRNYIEGQALNVAVKLLTARVILRSQIDLENKDTNGVSVLKELLESGRSIHKEVDKLMNGRSRIEITSLVEPEKQIDFQGLAGVTTLFPDIVLYPTGLSVLGAPGKIGKTRITLNIALDLVKKGYEVVLFDLENGIREMELRFYQLVLKECLGYSIPSAAFYCDKIVDRKLIEETYRIQEYSPELTFYAKGDTAYRVTYHKYQTEVDGLTQDTYCPKLEFMTALKSPPIFASDWETQEIDINDFVGTIQEALDAVLPAFYKRTKGRFKVCYISQARTSDMEETIQAEIEEDTSFFTRSDRRVAILDWMSLLEGSKEVWKNSRDNYSDLKSIQRKHSVFFLVIDGVSNPEKLYKAKVHVGDIFTKDNRQVKFDCANLTFLAATPEEQTTRCSRLINANSRWGASGDHVVMYVRSCPDYSQVYQITESEHRRLNPAFWEEIGTEETVTYDVPFLKSEL